MQRVFTVDGWRESQEKHRIGNPTAFSFCLALSSFFSCTLCLPDSVSIGWVQPVTTWHFKGQASKAGTSILSICDFTLWLLITLLHSIWRPESEGADAQFSLRIVFGCDRRERALAGLFGSTLCWIGKWLMHRGCKLRWLEGKTKSEFWHICIPCGSWRFPV